jgi:hypothetical protein
MEAMMPKPKTKTDTIPADVRDALRRVVSNLVETEADDYAASGSRRRRIHVYRHVKLVQ